MSGGPGALSRACSGRGFARLNFRRAGECAAVLRWLEAGAGERVLDVGSGDGFYDWRVSRSSARVTGIDLHEKRLAYARRHYSDERTEFLALDAERADFPAGSFDRAMSLCVMEHLGDDERVMRNVARALKPGGRFVFSADSLSNPGLTARERDRHRVRYAVRTYYTREVVRAKLDRTAFDLALVRISWALDRLPGLLLPLRAPGYLLLGAVWSAFTAVRGLRQPSDAPGGLTIVVRARKRDS